MSSSTKVTDEKVDVENASKLRIVDMIPRSGLTGTILLSSAVIIFHAVQLNRSLFGIVQYYVIAWVWFSIVYIVIADYL